MILNKQSSKGKSPIIPNVTEYLLLKNVLCFVTCIEMAKCLVISVSKMQKRCVKETVIAIQK